MTRSPEELKAIAAEWRAARRIYPIYMGIIHRFRLDEPPCRELECPIDRSEREALSRVREWLAHMDQTIQVYQLRLFLQTSPATNQATLQALVERPLSKHVKSDSDRDKVDFLLVQYFAQSAPIEVLRRQPALDEVADVLSPILGELICDIPPWLVPLEQVLRRLMHCRTMGDLLAQDVLAQARKIKKGAEDLYFESSALIVIARFNYLVRQTFFKLLRGDVDAIRDGLKLLATKGISTLNCEQARLSPAEPASNLLEICARWKELFYADYSAGHRFEQISKIRTAVEAAATAHFGTILRTSEPHVAAAANATASGAPSPVLSGGLPHFSPAAISLVGEDLLGNGLLEHPPAAEQLSTDDFDHEFSETDPLGLEPDFKASRSERWRSAPQASRTTFEGSLAATLGTAAALSHPRPAGLPSDVQAVLRQLADFLKSQPALGRSASATLVLGSARLVLSSWEVAAFVSGTGEFYEIMRVGVAVRVLLSQQLQKCRAGTNLAPLDRLIKIAHTEAARIQTAIAEARDSRDIESAVTLSATLQRLRELLEEAEQFVGQ
jgi:hypothetical protein